MGGMFVVPCLISKLNDFYFRVSVAKTLTELAKSPLPHTG